MALPPLVWLTTTTLTHPHSVGGVKVVGGVHFCESPASSSRSWSGTGSGRGGRKVVGGSSSAQFCFVFPVFYDYFVIPNPFTKSGRGGPKVVGGVHIPNIF